MGETATRNLDGQALAEIERSLHGRLRAHHVSDSFFERYGEDAVQKGVIEYLRARADGVDVREPRAFVVQAAFRRAIDELRREARRADGAALDRMLDSGRRAAAPAEEEAITVMEARRLQEAIDSLPAEERQVLALHYFEEIGQRRAAELLYVSERTFRRRLRRSLADLTRLLGAPAPDPGPHHGLEIGLAAWAGLGGGRVVLSWGAGDHLAAALESLRALPGKVLDRLRGPGARLVASEAPERIGAVAGGPAGKVLGGCAGAAVVCVLSGVVGPGLDLGSGPHTAATTPVHRADAAPASRHLLHAIRPIIVEHPAHHLSHRQAPTSTEARAPSPTPTRPAPRHRHKDQPKPKQAKKEPQPTESEVVEEQFSGVAQATAEAEAETSAASSEASSLQETSPPQSKPPSEPSPAASEERQVEEQFRGPLAR